MQIFGKCKWEWEQSVDFFVLIDLLRSLNQALFTISTPKSCKQIATQK